MPEDSAELQSRTLKSIPLVLSGITGLCLGLAFMMWTYDAILVAALFVLAAFGLVGMVRTGPWTVTEVHHAG